MVIEERDSFKFFKQKYAIMDKVNKSILINTRSAKHFNCQELLKLQILSSYKIITNICRVNKTPPCTSHYFSFSLVIFNSVGFFLFVYRACLSNDAPCTTPGWMFSFQCSRCEVCKASPVRKLLLLYTCRKEVNGI